MMESCFCIDHGNPGTTSETQDEESCQCNIAKPIGVFWDIENCSVPRGKSAQKVVQVIREQFFHGHREAIFLCVCDVSKESKLVIEELNKAQVMVVHINAVSKNAADDKLRQCLRRFANDHLAPATVILLSGDINFASELSDLRYRHHHHVILIHPPMVQQALLACSHQQFVFEELCTDVPKRLHPPEALTSPAVELTVSGLKSTTPFGRVRQRLKLLSDNCGGKVISVGGGSALLAFHNVETATKAQKRLDGELVFGSKIKVQFKNPVFSRNNVDEDGGSGGSSPTANRLCTVVSMDASIELDAHAGSDAEAGATNGNVVDNPHEEQIQAGLDIRYRPALESKADHGATKPSDAHNPQRSNQGQITTKEKENEETSKSLKAYKSTRAAKKRARRSESRKRSNVKRANHVQNDEVSSQPDIESTSKSDPKSGQHSEIVIKRSPPQSAGQKLVVIKPPSPDNFTHYPSLPTKADLNHPLHHPQPGSYPSHSTKHELLSDEKVRQQKELREVVARFNREHKTSRELVCIQQQLYNDDQESRNTSHERYFSGFNIQTPLMGYSREECHSAPPFSWSSPEIPSPQDPRHLPRRSPNFRRTPGASRPSSRCSHASSDYNAGGRAGSWYGGSDCTSPTSKGSPEQPEPGFKPVPSRSGPAQNAMLTASLLVSDSNESLNDGEYDGEGVEVMVSNLDYNISGREWRKILYAEFHQHVQILKVYIQTQPDNTSVAYIKVPSTDDARILICQFHRKKIGYKRIHIALANDENGASIPNGRSEVISLLKEVTGHRLPLFKFIELFEKRFHHSISVSELFRMKDTIEVCDGEGTGRIVQLQPEISSRQSSRASSPEQVSCIEDGVEWPVCRLHCEEGSSYYVDALDSSHLPWVILQVKGFAPQVHTLLQTHNGSMPLMSFPACYAQEFGSLSTVTQGGVPLEHLITCVPGTKVSVSQSGIKKVQWAENKPLPSSENNRRISSPVLSQQLVQFSREIVDLLKHSPHCRLPFSKFIPSYHHHFGRQCRVADYGFTRLMELFDALSHVVQVIGVGSRRFVTLTHRAQVKRFTFDLLRILKTRSNKQITILEFPIAYSKVIGKKFCITEFGVCYMEDLLCEVDSYTVTVNGSGNEIVISVAQRDQTYDETERTMQFAVELVDLLKHSPQCRMPFPKFIPSYHHHFGRQCRVADYGFTRLMEVFEAIPHVVKVVDEQDERVLCLTEPELLKVLEEQINTLLNTTPHKELPVPELLAAYMRQFGHSLRLVDYGVSSVVDLVKKIPKVAQVESHKGRLVIVLVDHSRIQQLSQQLLIIFLQQQRASITMRDLLHAFEETFSQTLDRRVVEQDLEGIVEVKGQSEEALVKLCSLQMFARDVCTILLQNQGALPLHQFEATFASHFGVSLVPASYGFPNVVSLLMAIPHVVSIQGKGYQRILLLAPEFQEDIGDAAAFCNNIHVTTGADEVSHEHDLMWMTSRDPSPYTLMVGSIPSAIPSPDLRPVQCPQGDLMNFDCVHGSGAFEGLDENEKMGLKTPLCRTPVSEMLQFAAQLLPLDLPPVPTSARHVSSLQEELIDPNTGRCMSAQSMMYPPMPVSAQHVDVVQEQLQAQAAQGSNCDLAMGMSNGLSYGPPLSNYKYNQSFVANDYPGEYMSCVNQSPLGPPPPPSQQWMSNSIQNIQITQNASTRANNEFDADKIPSQSMSDVPSPNPVLPATPPGLPSRPNSTCKKPSPQPQMSPEPSTPLSKTGSMSESPNKSGVDSPGSGGSQGTPRRSRIAAKFWNPISPPLDISH